MDGLEISEVLISELSKEFRLDSEYFKKEVLIYEKTVINFKKLKEVVNFLVGPFGSTVTADTYVKNSECFYLRGVDIGNFFLNQAEAKINEYRFNQLEKFHVRKEDIFITVVGTLGKIAINMESNLKAIFSCKSTIVRTNKINPYYLITFLSTNIGQKNVLRGKRGAIQEGLNITDLQEIRIPMFSNNFQSQIENLVKSSYQKIEESKILYKEAEELLFKKLDLLDFKPSNENIAVKSFKDSFGISGRLDSEYYQPKYDELITHIKKTKFDKLDNIVNIKKSIEPGSEAYQDEGIPFIRVSNITKAGITDTEIHLSKNILKEEDLEKLYPTKDTILLSKDGTVGIAYKIKNETEIITSGALLHLMIKRDDVLPEYLTLVLNSLVVQLQADRDAGGSIIKHWKPSEIQEILIPVLDISVQIDIEERIKKSFELKEESKKLLDLAKRAVEIAIEKNEDKAMEYINAQI